MIWKFFGLVLVLLGAFAIFVAGMGRMDAGAFLLMLAVALYELGRAVKGSPWLAVTLAIVALGGGACGGDDAAIPDCGPGEVFIAEGCPLRGEVRCWAQDDKTPVVGCGYHLIHIEPGQWDDVCVAECTPVSR